MKANFNGEFQCEFGLQFAASPAQRRIELLLPRDLRANNFFSSSSSSPLLPLLVRFLRPPLRSSAIFGVDLEEQPTQKPAALQKARLCAHTPTSHSPNRTPTRRKTHKSSTPVQRTHTHSLSNSSLEQAEVRRRSTCHRQATRRCTSSALSSGHCARWCRLRPIGRRLSPAALHHAASKFARSTGAQ